MKTFTFPDGMPHIKLEDSDSLYTLNYSIRNTSDLFQLGLIADVNKNLCHVDLHYVMGSRMDRAISESEPNTLRLVCNFLKLLNLRYTVIFPHSSSIIDRLEAERNLSLEISFLRRGIDHILSKFGATKFDIILPDQGAEKRFYNDHLDLLWYYQDTDLKVVTCSKHRDLSTGKLSGFMVPQDVKEDVIIIDDLGDGMGTFIGLAEKLREKGAKKIGLIIYHSIFSKGTDIPGVDFIYTSNSFKYTEAPNVFCQKVI